MSNEKKYGFNPDREKRKYGFNDVSNESVMWGLQSYDGEYFGEVSYGAYKAVNNGSLDSYQPKSAEEKNILTNYRKYPGITLKTADNKEVGNVSYDAYQALANNEIDSFAPYSEDEKKVIEEFRKKPSVPLKGVDGTEFGYVSYNAYQAIQNNKIDSYTPYSDSEKKVISNFTTYAENKAREERVNSNPVFKRYNIDPADFDYDDLEGWASKHNHFVSYDTHPEIIPKSSTGMRIGPWAIGKDLATDQEKEDALALIQLAENNQRVERSQTDMGAFVAGVTVFTDAATLGLVDPLNEYIAKRNYTNAGLDTDYYMSPVQAEIKTEASHPTAGFVGNVVGSAAAMYGVGKLVKAFTGGSKFFSNLPKKAQAAINSSVTLGASRGMNTATHTPWTEEEWDVNELIKKENYRIQGKEYTPRPYSTWGNIRNVALETLKGAAGGYLGSMASAAIAEKTLNALSKTKLNPYVIAALTLESGGLTFSITDTAITEAVSFAEATVKGEKYSPEWDVIIQNLVTDVVFSGLESVAGYRKGVAKKSGSSVKDFEFFQKKDMASEEALKKKYRELAKTMHPDVVGTDDGSFAKLTAEYKIAKELVGIKPTMTALEKLKKMWGNSKDDYSKTEKNEAVDEAVKLINGFAVDNDEETIKSVFSRKKSTAKGSGENATALSEISPDTQNSLEVSNVSSLSVAKQGKGVNPNIGGQAVTAESNPRRIATADGIVEYAPESASDEVKRVDNILIARAVDDKLRHEMVNTAMDIESDLAGTDRTLRGVLNSVTRITNNTVKEIKGKVGTTNAYWELFSENLKAVATGNIKGNTSLMHTYIDAYVAALKSSNPEKYSASMLSADGADISRELYQAILYNKIPLNAKDAGAFKIAAIEIKNIIDNLNAKISGERAKIYNGIKKTDTQKNITLKKVGDFYEAYGNDAVILARKLNLNLSSKVIDGESVRMVGFPASKLHDYETSLGEKYTFNVSDTPTVTHINEQNMSVTDEITTDNDSLTNIDANSSTLVTDFEGAVDDVLTDSDEIARQKAENRVAIQILKNTPDVILDNMAESNNLPVIINYTKLYLAARKNGVIKGHYHNFGEKIKLLPDFLQNPDMILKMSNGRINLITALDTNSENSNLVSVELNSDKDIDGKNKSYNVVVTVFAPTDNYLRNIMGDSKNEIVYKKRGFIASESPAVQYPATVNDKSPSIDNSISQDDTTVNSSIRKKGETDTSARIQKAAAQSQVPNDNNVIPQPTPETPLNSSSASTDIISENTENVNTQTDENSSTTENAENSAVESENTPTATTDTNSDLNLSEGEILSLKHTKNMYSVFKGCEKMIKSADLITDGYCAFSYNEQALTAVQKIFKGKITDSDNLSMSRLYHKENDVIIQGNPKIDERNGLKTYIFMINDTPHICQQKYVDAFNKKGYVIKANAKDTRIPWTVHDADGNFVALFLGVMPGKAADYDKLQTVNDVLSAEKSAKEQKKAEIAEKQSKGITPDANVVMYGSDNNKAVTHKTDLIHIKDNFYRSDDAFVVYFKDIDVGLELEGISNDEYFMNKDIERHLNKYDIAGVFDSADSFADYIAKNIENKPAFFKNTWIKFIETVNPDIAEKMRQSKAEYLKNRDKAENNATETTVETVAEATETDSAETVHSSKDINNTDNASDRWTTDRIDNSKKKSETTVNIAEIVKSISDKFGIPIATGKVTDREASGIYKEKPETIRTRIANNLPTISHELGHHLDKQYGLSKLDSVKELRKAIPKEFLDNYSADKKNGEAVAEFVRTYLRNKNDADRMCPDFYADFIKTLSKEDLKALNEVASAVNEYLSYNISERYDAAIVSSKKSEKLSFRDKWHKLYSDWVDAFHAQKEAVDYVENVTGQSLSGKGNAYVLATNSLNAHTIANYLICDGFRDLDGNMVDAKSFVDSIGMVDSKNVKLLDKYLVLRHSLEWIAPQHEDVMAKRVFADDTLENVEEIKKQIAEIEKEHPEIKTAAENLYEYQNNVIKHFVIPAGGMTTDTLATLNQKYPSYVPFYRAVGKQSGMAKGTFANQRSPIMRAKGSGALIISPVESIIRNTEKMVKFALRNQVMQTWANYADNVEGFGQFMEKVAPDMLPHFTDITQQKEQFADALQNVVSSGEDYFAVSDLFDEIFGNAVADFTPIANANKKIVTVLKNGTPSYYQIHDNAFYNSVAELSPQQTTGLLKVMNAIMQPMKLLITQNNPIFAGTNAIRDFGTAYKLSDVNNPITFAAQYVKALGGIITNSDDYKQYKAMGGGHSSELAANIENISRTLRKVAQKDMGKARRLAYSIFRHPVETVASLNDAIESIPRFAEFQRTLNADGDLQEAIYNASDITTNFKRSGKGDTARVVNKTIMFNNAAIQGIDKTFRTLTAKDPKKRYGTLLKWLLYALISGIIGYIYNDEVDEEGYKNLSSYKKNNFYNYAIGDGKFISLPKPRENALLDTFTERSIEYLSGNKEAFYDFGSYLTSQLLPPMLPDTLHPVDAVHSVLGETVAGGLIDIGFNQDFKGTPIESAYDEYNPSNERYAESTTKLAYILGQTEIARDLDLSPKKIDHLISSYTGILGQVNKALFPMNEERRDVTIGLRNKFISDSNYSTDVLNKMYENEEKAEKAFMYDGTIDSAVEYEQNAIITGYISGMNKAVKALPKDEQRNGRAYLLKSLNRWNYDNTASQTEMLSRLDGETVSDDCIVTSVPKSNMEWTVTTKQINGSTLKIKCTYQMTPQEYDEYIKDYLTLLEKYRSNQAKTTSDTAAYIQALAEADTEVKKVLKKKYQQKYYSKAEKVKK